jgi:MFS family permease
MAPRRPHPSATWLTLFVGHNGALSFVLAGGLAVHAVSVFVVATILPAVVTEIGGVRYYAWTSMLFVVGSIGGSAVSASMLARRGSRASYYIALALFIVGSLTCAVAPAMSVLLVGRLLQGFGGGMLPALGYACIRRLFPEPLWSRAISMFSGVWGIAALTGPFVGGVFASFGAWRWAFVIDVPIGLAFAAAAHGVLPRGDATDASADLPIAQLLVFAIAVAALASAGVAHGSFLSGAGAAVAIILLAGLLRLDRQVKRRLLPSGAFDPRCAMGAVSATTLLLAAATSATAFVPYLLQVGKGFSPMIGGYMAALQAMSWTIAALLTASAAVSAARCIIAIGPAIMAIGMAAMAEALSTGSLLAVAIAQILIGSGIGMGWAHMGALMMATAAVPERDVASSFISTTQLMALAFGSALAGIVVNTAGFATATTPAQVINAGRWLFAVFSIAPGTALLTSLLTLRAIPLFPSEIGERKI